MTSRGDRLSAFYASNVEFYLFADGRFPRFIENVEHLPRTNRSLIIRSVFGGYARAAAPGYASASITQPIDEMLEAYASGAIRSYRDLTTAAARPRD